MTRDRSAAAPRQAVPAARGTEQPSGRISCSVHLDEYAYADVLALAVKDVTSIAEQIRRLIRTGLKAADGIVVPAPRCSNREPCMALAKGRRRFEGRVELATQLEPALFDAVRGRALKKKTNFSDQVRLLVDFGLAEADDVA